MDSDTAIALTKAGSAFITGALGIAAVLFDYHNDRGRLTAGGYAVLIGIGLSSAVSVATTVFEVQKSKSESMEQIARNEALLKEVARAIQPITELRINYWLEIPAGNPAVDAYVGRVDEQIEKRLNLFPTLSSMLKDHREAKTLPEESPLIKGLSAWASDTEHNILNVKITKESDLWPQTDGAEKPLSTATLFPSFSLMLLKRPVELSTFRPVFAAKADLDATGFFPERSELDWDRKKKRLSLVVDQKFDPALWHASGKITSVVDLRGSQLLLLPHGDVSKLFKEFETAEYTAQQAIARSFKFRYLTMTFGQGRSLRIPTSRITSGLLKDGDRVYSVVFPAEEAAFSAFLEERSESD